MGVVNSEATREWHRQRREALPYLRKCYRCGFEARVKGDLSLFTKNCHSSHGRSNLCKACWSIKVVGFRAKRQAQVDTAKAGPCVDCGGEFNPVAMDFDHVRGEKRWTIAMGVRLGRPWGEIKIEITKCDLVCANCHRVRTWASERPYPNMGAKEL